MSTIKGLKVKGLKVKCQDLDDLPEPNDGFYHRKYGNIDSDDEVSLEGNVLATV